MAGDDEHVIWKVIADPCWTAEAEADAQAWLDLIGSLWQPFPEASHGAG